MKILITQLLGGLGNQMFQYAAGRRLSLDNNMRLLVDTSILEDHSPGRHEVNRHYGLGIFKLEVEKATALQRWFYNAQGLPFPVKALARLLRPWLSKRTYRERSFAFDEGLLRVERPPRYIHGLWQSYRYFESVAGAIAVDFQFRDSLPSALAGMGSELSRHESVCLNVRRGDYVHGSCAASMGFTGLDYYRLACRVMRQRLGTEPAYFVFSDDVEWCVQNLDWLGPRTVFVGHEYAGEHFGHYLQLMSLCPNFIIPNSTFGWWAAWLSKAPDKKVIAPTRWFVDPNVDTTDLCPPSWERL